MREVRRALNPIGSLLAMARRSAAGIEQFAGRLAELRLPRFGLVAGGLVAGSITYGVVLGGHTTAVIDSIAIPLGFSIETIEVSGNSETSEIDILQALWGTGAQTLISLDPAIAQETIEAMPWIERASVSKYYPNRIGIDLIEHRPYAVWQSSENFTIVDREGTSIVPFTPGRFDVLPVVVGEGAPTAAARILDEMEEFPELRASVKAYVRVGDRRWDLALENGVTIRLPEREPIAALAEVARMDREQSLLGRDILSVDMRVADRVVVKLTPGALERRDAALKERKKILKQQSKG
ncbi:cell division protein FtsQ [Fulvimarina pelagi HTCC2506]|uniref:Cell division protein FtsQ n=1 Tax=Fulvimarina pelagi HTCC2506 TaxID=314231 RepID=Q0G594_9HYPH|nr:cell division protein FtsQ/DivIB [Fulvimarina pelagi]EAU43170.1 cell division protein FtsQ [Fulvimarina pelagi HTCC2506]